MNKRNMLIHPKLNIRLMEPLPIFFDHFKKKNLTKGHFLGFINVLIGRRIFHPNGALISSGIGWRELANWLKKTRWDPEAARELGQDPELLPPRDRQRFWFIAISRADIASVAATQAGDRFVEVLRGLGYEVGSPPKGNETLKMEKSQQTEK
jgi:hypothetical protein